MISGVKIPDSKIAREAAELVRQHESEMLFNHSVRVFLFGAMKGIRQNLKFDSELLFVAALFHDLGLVDAYHTETKRFEVDGADAAREFLKSHGIPELKADLVWEAIALHTTPGIPKYMRPEIALTNAGVLVDVVGIETPHCRYRACERVRRWRHAARIRSVDLDQHDCCWRRASFR